MHFTNALGLGITTTSRSGSFILGIVSCLEMTTTDVTGAFIQPVASDTFASLEPGQQVLFVRSGVVSLAVRTLLIEIFFTNRSAIGLLAEHD